MTPEITALPQIRAEAADNALAVQEYLKLHLGGDWETRVTVDEFGIWNWEVFKGNLVVDFDGNLNWYVAQFRFDNKPLLTEVSEDAVVAVKDLTRKMTDQINNLIKIKSGALYDSPQLIDTDYVWRDITSHEPINGSFIGWHPSWPIPRQCYSFVSGGRHMWASMDVSDQKIIIDHTKPVWIMSLNLAYPSGG